jgi:hypothetical protein
LQHFLLGMGQYIHAKDRKYHRDCFRCGACNQLISGSFINNASDPTDKLPYHSECYKQLFAPICCVCSDPLPNQYLRHSFFTNFMYCSSHEYPRLRSCFVCGRKEPTDSRREPFQLLNDGRSFCFDCISFAVLDSVECRPIYLDIIQFFERNLGKISFEFWKFPIVE